MKYELNHIYNEDCYKAIKDIPDKSIDLIITDPPYEMVCGGHGKGDLADRKTIQNDKLRNNGLYNGFKTEILDEFIRVMKKINIYMWCSKNQLKQILEYFWNIKDKELNFDLLTWHKTNPAPLANMTYLNDTEYCINFREKGCIIHGDIKDKRKYFFTSLNKNDKDLFLHDTIKPIEIIKQLVINGSNENDIIADFFLGSGTTAVASKELNRQYIGFEIDKKWFDIANDRLNKVDANGQMNLFLR